MDFIIYRASDSWGRYDKPTDKATLIETVIEGKRYPTKRSIYHITINSIEDLIDLIGKEGKLVIGNGPKGSFFENDKKPVIMIYDDWIE